MANALLIRVLAIWGVIRTNLYLLAPENERMVQHWFESFAPGMITHTLLNLLLRFCCFRLFRTIFYLGRRGWLTGDGCCMQDAQAAPLHRFTLPQVTAQPGKQVHNLSLPQPHCTAFLPHRHWKPLTARLQTGGAVPAQYL